MRSTPILCAAVCAASVVAAMPGPLHSQTVVGEAALHALSVGDGSLTQFVLPFGVTWRAAGIRFDANAAYAHATFERDGTRSQLDGITDLTVRMLVPVMGDRARLILAGNVPTGTETLTPAQIPVAAVLTTDLLAMPVRSFGSGAGVTAGVAVAQPVGDWVAGGIAIYRVGGAYEPVSPSPGLTASEFRPGSEFRLRMALERPRVTGLTWRLAGSWSRFQADSNPEQDLFARGDRVLGEAVAEFPMGRSAVSMYGWTLYRSASDILAGPEPETAPASTLAGIGAMMTHPLTPGLSLRPRAELLVQRGEPGFGSGDGWIARVGSGASVRLRTLRFEPAVLVQAGGLEGDDLLGLVLRGGMVWER
jgi:hypothetical protein